MDFITEANKIYRKDDDGKIIAEVDFPSDKAGEVTITHTFVDDSLRGQGVAGELMKAVCEYAQGNNIKVVPLCSYAVKWFEKNTAYAHLLK